LLHLQSHRRDTPIEAQVGGEDVHFLLIHDLGTRWGEWSASRPGRALPPLKGPPVPIGYEAGWASEPVGWVGPRAGLGIG
jgi:hypothetical protein